MTPAEVELWKHLRAHRMGDVHFRSQHLIQTEYDEARTEYFTARGYRVLRFWNRDVMQDMESVLGVIWRALEEN